MPLPESFESCIISHPRMDRTASLWESPDRSPWMQVSEHEEADRVSLRPLNLMHIHPP